MFFLDIVAAYIVYRLMHVFFVETIESRAAGMVRYLCYFLMIWLSFLCIRLPVIIIAMQVLGLYLITGSYTKDFKKRVIATGYIYLIFLGTETVILLVSGYTDLDLFKETNYSSALGQVCIRVAWYIEALLMQKFESIKSGEELPSIYWLCILCMPVASIGFITEMLFKEMDSTIIVINSLVLLFLNLIVFNMYNHLAKRFRIKMEDELLKQMNQYYQKQFELIQISERSVRMVRHDIKNHLGTLRQLAEEREAEEIARYIERLMEDTGEGYQYVDTGNFALNSILNFKLAEAVQKKIRIDADIKIPAEMNMEVYDLTIILGNLLDNAISAEEESGVTEKTIGLKMRYDRGILTILVSNHFINELRFQGRKQLRTSKKDARYHGLGLKNVRKTVESYHGSMDIEADREKGEFTVLVMLFIAEKSRQEK